MNVRGHLQQFRQMKPISSNSYVDSRDLRQAFGRFGTGVTVVTTRSPDGSRTGVTVNSFNTVSLEPPIVLWSLSVTSPSLKSFQTAGHFVVNVLTLEQLELSRRLARPAEDKFARVAFSDGLRGVPMLAGCSATIECAVVSGQYIQGMNLTATPVPPDLLQ